MNNFEIAEYGEQWAQEAEAQFERYVRDDLKMELASEAIREKIWPGFLSADGKTARCALRWLW